MATNSLPSEPRFKTAADYIEFQEKCRRYPYTYFDKFFTFLENKYYGYFWLRQGTNITWVTKSTVTKVVDDKLENEDTCAVYKAIVRDDGKIISEIKYAKLPDCRYYDHFGMVENGYFRGVDMERRYLYK